MRVLLLEDDPETAAALAKGLTHEGHSVRHAADAETAVALARTEAFDVAVLDVMVPAGSGYQVLEHLRTGARSTPVLMLTALGSIQDRVAGLDRGADDYLVKPFSFAELTARLRALERRGQPEATLLCFGRLALDLTKRRATVDGARLELTQTEFGLLAALLRGAGRPLGRRELLEDVWGYEFDPGTNVVDVHVNRLRRKLEEAGLAGLVRTVRGQGYAAA